MLRGGCVGNKLLFIIIIIMLIVAGCAQPSTETPTPSPTKPQPLPTPAQPSTETPTPSPTKPQPLPTPAQPPPVGSLNFKEVSTFGHYAVASIEPADLDGDGDVDLVLASEENDSIIQVYENLGYATFRNSGNTFQFQSPEERHWNFGIVVVDFNGDTLPDIATADAWAGLNIYFNYGGLQFAHVQNYTFEGMGEVKGIASADLDNDGDIDIVLGVFNGENHGDRILFNDGSGRMVDSGQSINFDTTWKVFAIDINRDSATDFISVNRYAKEPARVNLNNGSGLFETTDDIPDTLDDSYDVKCYVHGNYTYCFIANSMGEHNRKNRILVFDKKGKVIDDKRFGEFNDETKDLCLVDLNSDGLLDIVAGNYNFGSRVYFAKPDSNGILTFEKSTTLFSIERTSQIGCDDFNGDGLIDFVVGIESANGGECSCEYYLLLQEPLP
jgi:hypothetical protein